MRVSNSGTVTDAKTNPPAFQDAVRLLQDYWARCGCIVWHPCNTEVGAGTMNPATFLRVLGPEPWSVAYEEPSIRPDDSRYGENPNRLQRHTQFQVIVKPAPDCAQELVLGSYRALGIDVEAHDVRFVEDNWQSPALGAWGLGWEVWLDGMEVTQFTYFQQAGGMPLDSVAVEITYGLERIVMALQGKTHFKDIEFAPGITYGEIFIQSEYEMSKYNLDVADIPRNTRLFDEYEAEALQMLEQRLPVPAYSYLLKASQTFNVLDARGAVGVTERARFFQRMRKLARDVAALWVERREELEYPLLPKDKKPNGNVSKDESELRTAAAGMPLAEKESFLFEIGLEELPPHDLTSMMEQVEQLCTQLLNKAQLSFTEIKVSGTPRRVVVQVKDLQAKQDDETLRVRGPPLRIAVDADGNVTKAAQGFLKKNGLDSSAIETDAVELDESSGYMYATVERKGKKATDVLMEALASNVLSKITFEKTMRWNDSAVAFSRPIRWLLCLLGDEVVPVQFAGVTSSNTTRSLRGGDGFATDVAIPNADSYDSGLCSLQVVLSPEERMEIIQREADKLAAQCDAEVVYDEGLLNEVVQLVENPIPIIGEFDASFLQLPEPVLVSVMKKHQRYFPVVDKQTKQLKNSFITVVNGDQHKVNLDDIRNGNEAVLRARYSDATFFYENDRAGKKLADFIPLLDRLAFQEKLGSMLDKNNRIVSATPKYCNLLSLDEDQTRIANESALLCKADLATSMVIEMTSLAGIMGRHYAEKSGETQPEVCDAIYEASLPRFSGDELPKSYSSAVVAVADRIDSLVALFSVGLVPKSTADPFALRRAALGVVQTLVELEIDVDITQLVSIAADELKSINEKSTTVDNINAVTGFVEKRLEGFLLDKSLRPDVVKAVLAVKSNATNPHKAWIKANSLKYMLSENPLLLENAAEIYGRTVRLLKSGDAKNLGKIAAGGVDENLFESDKEQNLLDALRTQVKALNQSSTGLDGRLRSLDALKQVGDEFFDGVFVLADDPKVRQNRMALCAQLAQITASEVDLSLLQL